MLSDQYQRWDRFDVDAAIAEADASALRDERMRGRTKARQALEALDAKVLAHAQELSATALSLAKVERLRAKRKRGRRRLLRGDSGPSSSKANVTEHAYAGSQSPALPLASQKSTLLEMLLKTRKQAEKALLLNAAADGQTSLDRVEVKRADLEDAILSGASLLALLPAASRAAASPHLKAAKSAAEEVRCGCSTPHNSQSLCLQPKPKPSAIDADKEVVSEDVDMCAVCLRALNDLRVYLSIALLDENMLTDAAGELKTVLLSDTSRADAWHTRGAAFLKMGVPLLAELHFKRAVEETAKRNNPYGVAAGEGGASFVLINTTADKVRNENNKIVDTPQSLETCKNAIVEQATMSRSQKLEALAANSTGSSVNDEEKRLSQLISQGHTIFEEGYFDSAALRYEAAVRKVQSITRESFGSDETLNLALLRALALEAHLRIAECLIERKMGYRRAILHCTRALRLEPENAEALRLRAYCLMERSEFSLAMEDLRRARSFSSKLPAAQLQRAADSGNSIDDLLVRAKHRCETWMKSANYSAIKRQHALARRPRSKHKPRMSIVLFVHESSLPAVAVQPTSDTMKTAEWMSEKGITFEQTYVPCADYPTNLEAILTGVHPAVHDMHGRKPLPETPTIAHLMQKGTGSGGMHDTAFCGSWPHHASTSDSLLRGFGEFVGIVDPSASASDTAKTAVNWIRERKQPFFLTVSLTNTAAEEPLASTDTAMGIVMDAVKAACEESAGSGIKWNDTVFISVSLPSRLNAARIHESAAEADLLAPIVVYTPVSEKQAASGMASRSVNTTTSILDIAPSVLGFAGLSGLLESRRCADYFETLSAYAGFRNPLPLPGRDMSALCLSGHSSRYLDESEFGFNDSFVENVFREGTASQGVSTMCKVVSPLANLLTNTQRTVSMCMDESCNHLLAPASTESDKTVYSAFTKTDGIMCRYFCNVGNHSPSGSKLEVLWYSVDDDLLNDTTRGAIEPINLRLRRMKIVARSERKQRLFDLSKDNGELQDIASHQAYVCIFKIGKRLLNEVRSLAK